MNLNIEHFQSQLFNLELTPEKLLVIAGIATLVLIFSVRILLRWYLGIETHRDEIQLLRRQLNDIQVRLAMMTATNDDSVVLKEAPVEIPAAAQAKAAETFRLLH